MCGIVGLFIKNDAMRPQLGDLLSDMLITMTDRGPDSAGIAIYSGEGDGVAKLTVQSDKADEDFATLANDLSGIISGEVTLKQRDTHAVVEVEKEHAYHWENVGFGGDCVYNLQDHVVRHLCDCGRIENTGAAYLRNLEIEEAVYQSAREKRQIRL